MRAYDDVSKEAPVKLSVATALAKDSQKIWEDVKGKRAQVEGRDVGRQGGGRPPPQRGIKS